MPELELEEQDTNTMAEQDHQATNTVLELEEQGRQATDTTDQVDAVPDTPDPNHESKVEPFEFVSSNARTNQLELDEPGPSRQPAATMDPGFPASLDSNVENKILVFKFSSWRARLRRLELDQQDQDHKTSNAEPNNSIADNDDPNHKRVVLTFKRGQERMLEIEKERHQPTNEKACEVHIAHDPDRESLVIKIKFNTLEGRTKLHNLEEKRRQAIILHELYRQQLILVQHHRNWLQDTLSGNPKYFIWVQRVPEQNVLVNEGAICSWGACDNPLCLKAFSQGEYRIAVEPAKWIQVKNFEIEQREDGKVALQDFEQDRLKQWWPPRGETTEFQMPDYEVWNRRANTSVYGVSTFYHPTCFEYCLHITTRPQPSGSQPDNPRPRPQPDADADDTAPRSVRVSWVYRKYRRLFPENRCVASDKFSRVDYRLDNAAGVAVCNWKEAQKSVHDWTINGDAQTMPGEDVGPEYVFYEGKTSNSEVEEKVEDRTEDLKPESWWGIARLLEELQTWRQELTGM